MRLSSATIDCWLQVIGPGYHDFEHHHWNIMGLSGTIGTAVGNATAYTWSLNGWGSDNNGSWSAIRQSKTINNGAQVRITSPANVTQATSPRSQLLMTGSSKATDHPADELTWPTDLTWNPGHSTPSVITFSDMGQPTYQLVTAPYVAPTGQTAPLSVGGLLLAKMSLVLVPGVGGRDYNSQTSNRGSSALAWWAWAINLVP